jgi:hypothetical protein
MRRNRARNFSKAISSESKLMLIIAPGGATGNQILLRHVRFVFSERGVWPKGHVPRKVSYIKRLREEHDESRGTLLVSAADKLYNARTILEDYREVSTEVWKRFKRGRDQQLWYFSELIKVYEVKCSDWRIIP